MLLKNENLSGAAIFETRDVAKSYGGVKALRGVTLDIRPGEILGLCGENGSGKSTLLKIISGQIQPTLGTLYFDGKEVNFKNPNDALKMGISAVTQERTLAYDLTVAENIYLSHLKPKTLLGINWKKTHEQSKDMLDRIGCELDTNALVRDILPGQAQMVEIARAIIGKTRILILDEPTSSLTSHEVEKLFSALRNLAAQGVSIIFISHRIEEIYAICNRLAVLRDGNLVSTGLISEYSEKKLIHDMIGRDPSTLAKNEIFQGADSLLQTQNFSLVNKFEDVSISLKKGEILGVIGLVGAGHSELLESIFGLHGQRRGVLQINGVNIRVRNPRDAMRHKIAFVPADRKNQGLVLGMSILENALMASTSWKNRLVRPRSKKTDEQVRTYSSDFNIVCSSLDAPVSSLSGGNQQKVLLTKWLSTNPNILLLDEPTRGVDVGAKSEIYRILLDQRDRGLSIFVSSSEIPELLTLCDRILVMFRGKVVANLNRALADESRIVQYAMGQLDEEVA
jgi:ABC-type sugar transport system ATPase subunit